MILSKKDILNKIEDLNPLSNTVNVKVFEDNKYLFIDVHMNVNRLYQYFKKLEFNCNGGSDIYEFYIIINNKNLTIQITELETVEELGLLEL